MPYRTSGLTPEEIEKVKERRRESQRRYYLANKQKCIDASLKSRAKNPERHKEVQAEYRKREKENIKIASCAYVAANAERLNAATVKWQKENGERFRAYQTAYRVKNAEKERARASSWKHENADAERSRLAQWAADNKDRRCISEQNRRERKRLGSGRLSSDIAKNLLAMQRGKCACCRKSLADGYHLDHIMPLALGGPHEDSNIQLLCPTCNLSKGSKHPVEFMQGKSFLL